MQHKRMILMVSHIYKILLLSTICFPILSLRSHFHKTVSNPFNAGIKSQVNIHRPETSLSLATPLLSLDRIVIPQHDRATLFKIGIIFIVSSVLSFIVKVFQTQSFSIALTSGIDKLKQLFRINTEKNIIDLKTWQTTLLSKVINLNDDYTMLQFDLPTKSLFDLEVDIGQEVCRCFIIFSSSTAYLIFELKLYIASSLFFR